MQKAIVIGANGQDGTFLVRHLLQKKYRVLGIGRQRESRWGIESPLFSYYHADLRDTNILSKLLTRFQPDLIFHVAAVHSSAGGIYEPLFADMLKVNVASVHSILEHLRQHLGGRFIYASSAKVFGDPPPAIITKDTPKKNQCLYSITKNTAYHLIEYYRSQHNVMASVVYLFNHESELRPDHFFISTIIKLLVSAIEDPHHVSDINTLDFYCNWGSAKEYMHIIIDMLEKAPSKDFVLATDRCIYARDLVKNLFEDYGLKYRSHIKEKCHSNFETNRTYSVDLTELKKYLGRTPQKTIYDVCKQIISLKYNLI